MTVRKPYVSLRQIASTFLIALLIVGSSPLAAYAEEVPPSTDTTTATATPTDTTTTTDPVTTDTTSSDPPTTTGTESTIAPTANTDTATSTEGPTAPTGADSTTYTYNEATGLWENDLYTWDPVTKQTAPKEQQTYSYNPETGRWDTTEWVYDAPSGIYIPNVISVSTPPSDATIVDSPTTSTASTDTDSSAKNISPLSSSSPTSLDGNSSVSSDQPKSTGLFDLFYNASISNTLTSLAQSGDATVALNTLAGSALTGSASAIATVINLLQSSWNFLAGSFTTFTQNLFGNFFGDLTLNPGKTAATTSPAPNDLTINADQSAAINNEITLEAVSGDATVTQNTSAGDATSGDATAIANLVNAINTSISSGTSFIGMLNIFGNLNGDILLPPELTQTLLAANTVGTLDTSNIDNTSVLADFTNNQSITNNVTMEAASGDATVTNNTTAGDATTGNAQTNLTVLNLTGRQIIGKDALLVFVNVLGTWVGIIVNAPTGSTSAALGGGITGNDSLSLNATDNQTITNDISVGAHSGNALVDSNTRAGNATSGDAKAAVNLVNISGSQFALSDWFGILFINVFGRWDGSFGINTAAGNLPTVPTGGRAGIGDSSSTSPAVSEVRAFRFSPTANGSYTLESVDTDTQVLAALSSDNTSAPASPHIAHIDPPLIPKSQDWTLSILGVVAAGSLLGTERLLSRKQRLHTQN